MSSVLRLTARPIEVLLGAFFLFAAFLKVQNPNLFAVQIHEYQVLTDKSLLGPAALFFIVVEMTLGAAMVLGLRLRGLTLAAVQLLLVFFTGLIAYAWAYHGLKDCGCMGEVRMGPGVSIVKNAIMMVLVCCTWAGRHVANGSTVRPETGIGNKVLAAAIIGLVSLSASYVEFYRSRTTGAPPPENGPQLSNTAPGPFSKYVITTDAQEKYDLGHGVYLVALLSSTCEHCMATVPTLNEFVLRPDVLPTLVGLCYEPEPGSLEIFRITTAASFPLYSLGDDFLTFSQYIGQEPPRLSLVRDGHAIQSWDGVMPALEELVAAVQAAGNAETPPA